MRRRRLTCFARALALAAVLALAVPLLGTGAPARAASETAPPSEDVSLAYPGVAPPGLDVQSAVLMEAESGLVLYSYQPDRAEPPASLTKMMTVDLALEDLAKGAVGLDDEVPVSERAWALAKNPNVSRMFIEPRLPVTVEQLLYGIMVSSGNDAAVALAEYLAGGSEEAFVSRMNAKAADFGMKGTHFADAAGLAEGGTTTAIDMARLARHLVLDHPEVLKYSATKSFQYNIPYVQKNYNTLLFSDPRVDGLKTGNIGGLYHLVATGKVGDMRLIAVVMGTSGERERAEQAEALIDWGFRSFEAREERGSVTIPVYKGTARNVEAAYGVRLVAPKDLDAAGLRLETDFDLPDHLVAPVAERESVGKVVIRVAGSDGQGGREFAADAKAAGTVPRGGFFRVLWDSIRLFFRALTHVGA